MANLFGILTAAVLALSALIAFKNKGAYETSVSNTQTQQDLLAKSEARLKAAQEVLEALPVERAGVDAEIVSLTESESTQQKAERETKEKITTITAKITENKEKLDGIREKTSKIGNLKELSSKMRATSGELEELTQSISAAEATLANITAQNSTKEAQVGELKGKLESYSTGNSIPSMKTRIRSIYPNWGFVTLASGNNGGVVANSTLDVVRHGETIAKLLVTAVETSSSSASIVPDSMSGDVTLSVGDLVIPGQAAAK